MSSDNERRSLAAKFDCHVDEEGSILAEYRILAEGLGDSSAGMLVNQILTDEEMHHLLLRTMATWLRGRSGPSAADLPAGANKAELLRLTHALQQHERDTIEACRDLQPQLSGDDAQLFGTLLDAMVLDSEKHRRLLEAVEKLLKR